MENRNSQDFRSRIETSVFFGEMDVVGETRPLFFKFKDANEFLPEENLGDLVEDIVDNCSCSGSSIVAGGISANFTYKGASDGDAVKWGGRIPYETSITVYFKDGKPLKIKSEKDGTFVYNPDKARVYLIVYGTFIKKV